MTRAENMARLWADPAFRERMAIRHRRPAGEIRIERAARAHKVMLREQKKATRQAKREARERARQERQRRAQERREAREKRQAEKLARRNAPIPVIPVDPGRMIPWKKLRNCKNTVIENGRVVRRYLWELED